MLRYNRQIVLRGFDFDGQEALKAASVLVWGWVVWAVPPRSTWRRQVSAA
jgi:molybdopterin/thiamine biosynthesis adenylyltransferase